MSIDILIPSCKDDWDLSEMIGEMVQADRWCSDLIYYSCLKESASINRNNCLDHSTAEYVIMVDDDITGFFPCWYELLVEPLKNDPKIIYVSARLMNELGEPQMVMGFSKNIKSPIVEVPTAPSAAVAFRSDGSRFDEQFVGCGWEDSLFVEYLKHRYPGGKVVVNNNVKLTHKNEMKNQLGENYKINEKLYYKKILELKGGTYEVSLHR